MEYVVKQTKSGLSAEFEVCHNNQVIAGAVMANNFTFGGAWQYYNNNELAYKLTYKPAKQLANVVKRLSDKEYDFYEIENRHGEIAGSIKQKDFNGGFFNKYAYYEISFNGKVYTFYAIGLGKQGNKFPLYDGECQVALIEKACVVHNNLDEYLVTATDEASAELAALVSLYIDSVIYANRGEIIIVGITKTFNLSFNKKLISKYNPKFKDSVSK